MPPRGSAVRQPSVVRESSPPAGASRWAAELRPARWDYVPPPTFRASREVMVEPWLREALIRLNPEIAAQPDRADEVLYNLRAIILLGAGRRPGAGQRGVHRLAARRASMPFGANGEHVHRAPDRLRQTSSRTSYVVTNQFTYRAGSVEKRARPGACWSTACRWSWSRPRRRRAAQ